MSRICAGLDEAVSAFRSWRLDHLEFPYVWLDATCLHVRDGRHVTSKAVVIATGVSSEGSREVLGLDVGDSEDETFWRTFLRDLRARGLQGVQLVISDQHAGLLAALRCVLQGAAQFDHVTDVLAERFGEAAELMAGAKEEVLAFAAFPRAHWRQIWSTNP